MTWSPIQTLGVSLARLGWYLQIIAAARSANAE